MVTSAASLHRAPRPLNPIEKVRCGGGHRPREDSVSGTTDSGQRRQGSKLVGRGFASPYGTGSMPRFRTAATTCGSLRSCPSTLSRPPGRDASLTATLKRQDGSLSLSASGPDTHPGPYSGRSGGVAEWREEGWASARPFVASGHSARSGSVEAIEAGPAYPCLGAHHGPVRD